MKPIQTLFLALVLAALAILFAAPSAAALAAPAGAVVQPGSAAPADSVPVPPVPALPYVSRIYTDPAQPCAGRPSGIVVEGEFPDGCGLAWPDSSGLGVVILAHPPSGVPCEAVIKPWRVTLPLGMLAPGVHRASIRLQVLDSPYQGVYAASLTWQVAAACDSSAALPFVEHVLIGTPDASGALRVCANDSFPVRVDGHFPDACWSLQRLELKAVECFAPCPPVVRVVLRRTGAGVCATQWKPFSGEVWLSGLPAGSQSLRVELEEEIASADSGPVVAMIGQTFSAQYPFTVQAGCDSTVPPGPGPLPFVTQVRIGTPTPADPKTLRVCPGQSYPVAIAGFFPDGCWNLESVTVRGSRCFTTPCLPTVRVVARHAGGACPTYMKPFSGAVVLPGQAPGDYVQNIELVELTADGSQIGDSHLASYPFRVESACDTAAPPGPLRFLSRVQVGDPDASGAVCIAAGDSFPVTVGGTLPMCYYVRGVQLLPSMSMQPAPQPPILRVLVDDGACIDRFRCPQETTWSARVMLPGLPARTYQLITQVAQVSCSDSVLPGNLGSVASPFSVAQACSSGRCLSGGWVHPNAAEACDAHAAPGRTVTADFTVRSPVALSGLQGVLTVSPAGMLVLGLEAVGPAAGMHVNWSRGADGTHFVMYSEHGAPIPATPWAAAVQPPAVLRVTLYPDTDLVGATQASRVMGLFAGQLLGADSVGTGVSECPQPVFIRYDPFYNAFRICTDDPCDFNADGRSDVRDLVLMVRCINGLGPCVQASDSTQATHDCDRSGAFDQDDVVCCARSMLRDTGCPECVPGDTTGTRPEPTVRVALDPPLKTTQGADVALHVAGAARLGAVSLALSYPFERYDVTGVDFPGDAAGWLHLFQVQDGRVRIALIGAGSGVAGKPASDRTLNAVIHLALKAGSEPGGQVGVSEGQFSGPDGAGLKVDLGSPAQWLAPARLVLSANRPNPFAANTRFSLDLDQASDVEVAIFDVTGRRVATVYRGHLPQGTREFQWDGRTEAGTPASSGIYFSRVTSLGRLVSRKMLLVRGS